MCCCSVTQLCLTLCNPMDCSTPGFPVLHHHLESAQTRVHWVGDAIQPSHPSSFPSPPAFNLSQHQGLFQWVSSSHQVAKVLELYCPIFQWIFRVDFLWDWLVWSPCCPRDFQKSSPAAQFEGINSKPALSLSSFTLIKRLFISSSISVLRVVSSAYLRLLMFLLPILIPACNSSLDSVRRGCLKKKNSYFALSGGECCPRSNIW